MSSVNIAELLDQMDEVIENATASMLSSKRYIDIPAMQELIAQTRENLPTEIEQATQIVRDRSAILKDAKQEAHETQEAAIRNADNLRESARREAEALTSKARLEADTMMEKARRDSKAMMQKAQDASDDMVAKAEETISQAQKWSHDMRTGASEFVERIMRTSDEQLTQYVNEIRRARQSLRASGKVEEEPQPEPKQDAQK